MPSYQIGQPEIERDRWGRPMVIPAHGGKAVAYTRATTLAGAVDDTSGLMKWKARMTLLGAAKNPHLATAALAAGDNKWELNKLADKAAEAAGGDVAAITGTSMHSFTERIDRGEPMGDVPEVLRGDVLAYQTATAAMKRLHIEQFVVCDELKAAGTPDLIVEFEGERYIADKKTGSVDYPHKMAAQLAIYAHSQMYDIETGRRTPLPAVNGQRGIIIHLPAGEGTAQLYWVNIAAGWEAAQLGVKVNEWRKHKGLLQPIDDFTLAIANLANASLIGDPITAQLLAAPSVPEALSIFDQNKDVWTVAHAAALTERIFALTH